MGRFWEFIDRTNAPDGKLPLVHATDLFCTVKSLLPVCLVMSRELLNQAIRVMPFDTGAFDGRKMHPPMHDQMKLRDFELTGAKNAPMKLIEIFYGNERSYYEARAKPTVQDYDEYDDLEIDAYVRLLHHRANNETDDRVTAVEVQLNDPLELTGRLDAAILPKPYFDRPGIAEQIEAWGGIAIPYRVKEEFVPKELQGAIFDKLTEFLESKNLL